MAPETMTGSVKMPFSWWRDTKTRISIQVLLIIIFSAVAALGQQLAPSMHIPGSSGFFWLTPLILGRMLVKRNGSGTIMGLGMAGWGIAFGFNKPLADNLALYGITGAVIDLLAFLPFINIRNIFGAVLIGFSAHIVKFGFIVASALTFGGVRHFLTFGLLKSALLHAGIGIASAIIAWIIYKSGQKALSSTHKEDKPLHF